MTGLKISEDRLAGKFAMLERNGFFQHYPDLGVQKEDGSYLFEFFNQSLFFKDNTFDDRGTGAATLAVQILLATYMTRYSGKPGSLAKNPLSDKNRSHWVTIRELFDGGPLFSSFSANTAKTIEHSFQGRISQLQARCIEIGGSHETTTGFDLSVRFHALPCVPVILNFNDADDIMPAQAGLLFQKNADRFLDSTAIGIIITYLTGRLIQGPTQ